MPPRSKAPGLKRGRHRLPYWIARQVVRDPMGYPDACIALPVDADAECLAELCCQYTESLLAWIAQQAIADGDTRRYTRYDGSVRSVCRMYEEHPESPFRDAKRNTQKYYSDSFKVIVPTVGERQVRNVTVPDVKRWYRQWRAPKLVKADDGKFVAGAERIDRAHDAVTVFRTALRFAASLKHKECGELDALLAKVRFEKGGAREQEMTLGYGSAFIAKALAMEASGVIPAGRGLAMAIGTAAQFELMLRQKDIIGEWAPKTLDMKIPRGAVTIDAGDDIWMGYFTWEQIAAWRWRTRTSKSKYRSPAEFFLDKYSLLFPLLERVPHAERTGAIIKGEHGLPVRERSYRKWFRQIARAAGIPDEVWNMDNRAGGATEAEEAGVDRVAIQDALTHSRPETTVRYLRRRSTRIAAVNDARKAKRAADQGEG